MHKRCIILQGEIKILNLKVLLDDSKAVLYNDKKNAYLFGSSEQYGVFSWNMPNAKGLVGKMKVTVKAKFGGGDTSDSSVVKSWTSSRILGTDSYSFWVTMYDANTNYVGK